VNALLGETFVKSNALIFSFSLVALLCGVCREGAAQTPCDISSRVVPLAINFDPVSYGNCEIDGTTCDKPPQSGSGAPVPSAALADIVAAFNIAPLFFQQELCSLDKIYIDMHLDSTNPMVWGMRERLHQNSQTKRQLKHIGISVKVWDMMDEPPICCVRERNTQLVA
jgi:hypothetical protein